MAYEVRKHGQRFHFLAYHKYTNWYARDKDLNYGEITTVTDYLDEAGPFFDKFAFAAHYPYPDDNNDKYAKPYPYSQDWAFFDADNVFNAWEANKNIVDVYPTDEAISTRSYQHDNRSQIRFGYAPRKPSDWIPANVSVIPSGPHGNGAKNEMAVLVMDQETANREIAIDLYGVREYYDLREGDGWACSDIAFPGGSPQERLENFTAPAYYRFESPAFPTIQHNLYYFLKKPTQGSTLSCIHLKAEQPKNVNELDWTPVWQRTVIQEAAHNPWVLATNDAHYASRGSTRVPKDVEILAATCVPVQPYYDGSGIETPGYLRAHMQFYLLMQQDDETGTGIQKYIKEWGFASAPGHTALNNPHDVPHRRWDLTSSGLIEDRVVDLHYDVESDKLFILEKGIVQGYNQGTSQNQVALHWPLRTFNPAIVPQLGYQELSIRPNGIYNVDWKWGQATMLTTTDDSIVLVAPYGGVNTDSPDRLPRMSNIIVLSKGDFAANKPAGSNDGWTRRPGPLDERSFACNRVRHGRITSVTPFGDHAIMTHHDNNQVLKSTIDPDYNVRSERQSRSYRRILDPDDLSENSTTSLLTRHGKNIIGTVMTDLLDTDSLAKTIKMIASEIFTDGDETRHSGVSFAYDDTVSEITSTAVYGDDAVRAGESAVHSIVGQMFTDTGGVNHHIHTVAVGDKVQLHFNDTDYEASDGLRGRIKEVIDTMLAQGTHDNINIAIDTVGESLSFEVPPTNVNYIQNIVANMFQGGVQAGVTITFDEITNTFTIRTAHATLTELYNSLSLLPGFSDDKVLKPDTANASFVWAEDDTYVGARTEIKDIVGEMISGNTEVGINVAYDGTDHTLDFTVSPTWIKDQVGEMVDGGSQTGIEITYDSASQKFNAQVIEPYITNIIGDMVAGGNQDGLDISVGLSAGGRPVIDVSLDNGYLFDEAAEWVTGNVETGLIVSYNKTTRKINFEVVPEYFRDIVGTMVAGDQTGITVTHDDTGNVVDFIIDQAWLRDQVGAMFIRNTSSIWPTYDRLTGRITMDAVEDWVKDTVGQMFTGNPTVGMYSVYSQANKNVVLSASLEYIRDAIGDMLSGNTETGIEVVHDDAGDVVDFVVDENWLKGKIGEMLAGNTEVGINVDYDPTDHTIDFQVQDRWIRDVVGGMFSSNDGIGIYSEYNAPNRTIDLYSLPAAIVDDQRHRIQTMAADMFSHNLHTLIEVDKHTDPSTSEIHFELSLDAANIVNDADASQAIRDIAGALATDGDWDGIIVGYDRVNGWLNFGLNYDNVRSTIWDFLNDGSHNGISLSHQPASGYVNISIDDDYIYTRMKAIVGADNQMEVVANDSARTLTVNLNTLDKATIESGLQNVVGWAAGDNYMTVDGNSGEIAAKPVNVRNGEIAALFTAGNHNGVSVGYSGGTINIGIHDQDVQDIVGTLIANGQQTNIVVQYDRSRDAVNFTVGAEGIEDIVGALFTRYTNDSTSIAYVDNQDKLSLEIDEDWLHDNIGGFLKRAESDMLDVFYDAATNELELRINENHFRDRIADFLPLSDGFDNGIHFGYDHAARELSIDLHRGVVENLIGDMFTRSKPGLLSGGLYVEYNENRGHHHNDVEGLLLGHIDVPWVVALINDMLVWPSHTDGGIEVHFDAHNQRFEFSYIPSVIGSMIGNMIESGAHRNLSAFYKPIAETAGELSLHVDNVSTNQVRRALEGGGVRDGGAAVLTGDLNPEIVPGMNEQVLKIVNDKLTWAEDKDTDTRLQASQIQQVVASMFAGGQHKGLIGGYNTATGKIDFTVTFDFDVMNEAFLRQVAGRPAGQYWLVLNKENNS